MEFTNNPSESGDKHRQMPAVKVPTVDGYPVDVDVTVLYRIKDPYLVASKFGFGTGYEESVVIRFTDPLVKQYLGELRAEEFYHEKRLDQVRALKADLARRFTDNGLELADVLIRQYDYPETFQALTEQKKIQDQSVLTNRALAKQAEVQTRLNQTIAEGQNLINVKTAEFNAQITEINAQKDLYERQKHAEADLLVKSAEANGTEQINRALEGAGSAKLLRLRRGLALLNGIKGPIYITEDPTDLGKLSSEQAGEGMNAMRKFPILACGLPLSVFALAGCTPHTTQATEVGVKFNKITSSLEIWSRAPPTSSCRWSTTGRRTTSRCATWS